MVLVELLAMRGYLDILILRNKYGISFETQRLVLFFNIKTTLGYKTKTLNSWKTI